LRASVAWGKIPVIPAFTNRRRGLSLRISGFEHEFRVTWPANAIALRSQQQVMTSFAATMAESHAVKCELAAEVLRSSGALRLQVTGSSMLPTVWPGDTLLIECVENCAVSVGDIVLFGRDRRLFVHRVTGKIDTPGELKILTCGDAMPQPDPPVPEGDLLGKVSFISRNGKLIVPRKTPRWTERVIAALARSSDFAARVVVGIRGMCQT
jgi:signal peptidase I